MNETQFLLGGISERHPGRGGISEAALVSSHVLFYLEKLLPQNSLLFYDSVPRKSNGTMVD